MQSQGLIVDKGNTHIINNYASLLKLVIVLSQIKDGALDHIKYYPGLTQKQRNSVRDVS